VLGIFDEAIEAVQTPTPSIEDANTTPPDDNAPPPSQIPLPAPSDHTQPRRSARIRGVQLFQGRQPPQVAAPPMTKTKLAYSSPPAPEPRRSTRILKRRLQEEDQHGAPPLKSRRIKK
jgi:hypothetical protein